MFIAYITVAIILSILLIISGSLLLAKDKSITATLTELGVPLSWYPLLAAAKFAGALGLLAGIGYRPLGVAAATGVVLYFAGAVLAHLRTKDVKGTVAPLVLTLISAAPLVLGLQSA